MASNIKALEKPVSLKTVNNRIVTPIGNSKICITVGNQQFFCEALVLEEMPRKIILGTGFLVQHGAIIDYSGSCVELMNHEGRVKIPFKNNEEGDKSNVLFIEDEETENIIHEFPVKLNTDVTICPNETINVSATTNINFNGATQCNTTMVPNETWMRNKKLIITKTIRTSRSKILVEIKSKAHIVTRLFKGTTLGHMSVQRVREPTPYILLCDEGTPDQHSPDYNINKNLNSNERRKMEKLLKKYEDVFSTDTKSMGFTTLTQHEIDAQGAAPIKSKPYKVSQKEREIINEQIEEMLQHNIIRPSKSAWSSPIVLVKKRDGKIRFCVDYRKLNAVTKKRTYPMPNIDDLMTYLGNTKYFSTLDLYSGYWQVGIEEKSKEYTAFAAQGQGLYEFNVLPFGLSNGPSTFQDLADRIFEGMKWSEVLVYLDDIIVFSSNFEEHMERLEKVFQRLRQAGLTLKPSKCNFMEERVKILGYVVESKGISPDKDKIDAIQKLPKPKNVKQLQSFLGMCNFYRKFIENYSKIARPLYEATSKSTSFTWGAKQDEAFNTLKKKMIETPVLIHFNPNEECELRTDACGYGIGSVLLQKYENQMHPVAYISRTLTKAEQNYTVSELEALGVIWSLNYLRHLVYGRHIRIITDHHALCWLKSIKDLTGRLARWSIKLAEFDYTIIHKSGKRHKDADCLSRQPTTQGTKNDEEESEEVPTFLMEEADLTKLQKEDKNLDIILRAIQNPDDEQISISIRRKSKNFAIHNNVLYKKNSQPNGVPYLLVIPKKLIPEILYEHHNGPLSGHLGVNKTYNKIKSRYFWDGQIKDVIKYVKGCADCQARKGATNFKPGGCLQPIPVATPMEKIGIDLLGPFRKTNNGNTMIVVATDYATRWAETKALPNGTAKEVANFVCQNIITRHGAPKTILSDRGTTFRSELLGDLTKCMGIERSFTTAYHPQCNGLTERLNHTLADMLSMYTNTQQTNWDEYLDHVTFAYNTAKQDTTQYSPFMLLYAREPILPTEANLMASMNNSEAIKIREKALFVRNQAVENISKKQGAQKTRYDEKHRHIEYQEGDKVKIFTPTRKIGRSTKLLLRWYGPYVIKRKLNEVNYEVQKGLTKKAATDVVHVSRILPYHDPWTPNTET